MCKAESVTVRSVKCQLNFDGRLESVGGSLLVSAQDHRRHHHLHHLVGGPCSFLPPVILVMMMIVTMIKDSCSHDRDDCNDNRKEGTTKPTNFGSGHIHFSPRSTILGIIISPAPDYFHSRCTICASYKSRSN